MSFVTDAEVEAINASKLSRDSPFLIRSVRSSIFSMARFFGGVKVRGDDYTYLADTDELIRDDVLKFVKKMRKSKGASDA